MMALASGQLCRHYSLADVEIATENFDDRLVVGQGGFGKVYKGHIKSEESSSTVVAIKRLDPMSNQGTPEFRAEIEMLSKLRHSHLVSLLGYCDDGKEMILLYEYMPRGTLYHHLHNSNTLSWVQRLRISLGAARGLDYLHTGAGTQHGVIHRDVKSANILLDEDWAAKISDLGLAKIGPINQPCAYVSASIKGTFGYLDPEFFLTGKLTRKTDVFAFGVVLFELLSGRHAVFPDENLSLAGWVQNCGKKRNLKEIVGDEIRGQLSPKSLKEFAQIAYRCLHSCPKERPTMSEVVVALELSLQLQEKFDNSAQPAGIIGLTWKMQKFFVLPTKEIAGSRNGKININCCTVPAVDGGDYNEVLPGLKRFSYTDLECATRNFGNRIMIGQDWVFKGWVDEKTYSPSDLDVGLAIIVKDFEHRPEGDLQLLGEFSHPNLHRLLGYCLEDGKLYLVHEFIEQRSLEDYLHKGAATEIPFVMRVKIAVGVARGLVFLHHKQLSIMDWMPDTNEIWLDKDFNAKLFHFDVARLVNRLAQYPSITGPWFPIMQCDVYGLGLLLMEILTGECIFTESQRDLVCEMSDKMIDLRINLNAPQIESAHELRLLIRKCIRCLYIYTMEQALEDLEQIYSRMTER